VEVSNRQVAEAFVELAGTHTPEFDLAGYLSRLAGFSIDLLGASAAVVLMAAPSGPASIGAATDPRVQALTSRALRVHESAGINCSDTGSPVRCHDLTAARPLWPWFAGAAHTAGFGSVYAFPIRRHDEVVGALEVFADSAVGLGDEEIALGQALADAAAIRLLNERDSRSTGVLIDQLQGALDSRVVIEQAKGILAERFDVDVDEAFDTMRRQARNRRQPLHDVARSIVASPAVADGMFTTGQPR
jgi:hypothetical protein